MLFYGMAGAGKTACALELAYRYPDTQRFQAYAWWQAPKEGDEIAGALADFALALESQLPGLELVGFTDDPQAFHQALLPRLKWLLENYSILLVIDNLEGLLTQAGGWRDAATNPQNGKKYSKWGDLVGTLLGHGGLSRLALTARRRPAGLPEAPILLQEAVHALSLAESVTLARELPHLGGLFGSAAARGEEGQKAEIEAVLPGLEENGWKIAAAIRRMWAGEREAGALTAGIDENSARLVRRALDMIAEGGRGTGR